MAEVSRSEEAMVAGNPALMSIVDQIADGLPGAKKAKEAAAAPAEPTKPEAKPEAKAPEKPRDEQGKFKGTDEDKRARNLSEQRKIIEAAVQARKQAEAEKSDLQLELEALKVRLHGQQAVPETRVDLDAVIEGLVKSGELGEQDAKHYRGPGKKVIEALVKANTRPMDAIDPQVLAEFKNFSDHQKYLRAVGSDGRRSS